MITGYNTDVRYRDKVFHVQTEDKGTGNPYIESVVYFGGQVLVAKRAGYGELLDAGKGAEEISARMDQQHRMLIAAIKGGKLDTRIRELLGPSFAPTPIPEETRIAPPPSSLLEQARSDNGPSLDQVILDYLTAEAHHDQLEIALGNGGTIAPGTPCRLELRATSGKSGLPVSGAQVTVKMISTVRDPVTLAKGTTDEDGLLRLEVEVPSPGRGSAAVIISATSVIGSAEIKQLL